MHRRRMKPNIVLAMIVLAIMNVRALPAQDEAALAQATVKKALSLQHQGQWAEAESLLARTLGICGEGKRGQQCRSIVSFGWAYLKEQLASHDTANTRVHLALAASLYKQVLDSHPNNAEVANNLVLVHIKLSQLKEATALLRGSDVFAAAKRASYFALIGDSYEQSGDLTKTLAAFKMSLELDPTNERVAYGILRVYQDLPTSLLPELLQFSQMLKSSNLPAPAAEGFAQVILRSSSSSMDLAERALLSWVDISANQGSLSVGAVSRFRGSSIDSVAPSPAPIRELESMLAADYTSDLDLRWWKADLLRRNIAAKILKIGADRLRIMRKVWEAIQAYEQALKVAPNIRDYMDSKLRGGEIAALDIVQELAVMYHKYSEDSKPDVGVRNLGARYSELVNMLFRGKEAAYQIYDWKAIQKFHTVLGLIYAERDEWTSTGPTNAIFQLDHALQAARRRAGQPDVSTESLPYLKETLARGYAKVREPSKAYAMFLDAAAGYLDTDNQGRAGSLLDSVGSLRTRNGAPYRPSISELAATQTLRAIVDARLKIGSLKNRWDPTEASRITQSVKNLPESSLEGAITSIDNAFLQRQYFKLYSDLSSSALEANDKKAVSDYQKEAWSVVRPDLKLSASRDFGRIEKSLQMQGIAPDSVVYKKATVQMKQFRERSK